MGIRRYNCGWFCKKWYLHWKGTSCESCIQACIWKDFKKLS